MNDIKKINCVSKTKETCTSVKGGRIDAAQPVGAKNAYSIGCYTEESSIPADLTYTFDNTAGTEPKKFFVFDALGLVAAIKGIKANSGDVPNLDKVMLARYWAVNPMILAGLRVEVSKSTSQFKNKLILSTADVDGQIDDKLITLATAVNSGDYNPKIQFFTGDILINERKAMFITVEKGESVDITFYFKAFLNRF